MNLLLKLFLKVTDYKEKNRAPDGEVDASLEAQEYRRLRNDMRLQFLKLKEKGLSIRVMTL